MRIKKRILQKIFSTFSALVLLLNSFAPYIPVAYSTEPLQTNISFSDNSFQLSANTSDALTYLLAYKTPGNIEGTTSTNVEKSDSNFSKEIYAGIKSGDDARKDEVIRGIYKLESSGSYNEKRFTFEGGSLKIVDETLTGSMEVTAENTNWLETGTDTIEQTCTDEAIDNNTYIDWNTNLDEKTAETKDKVKVGITYVFPLENKVTVKFNCLPKNEALRTTLKIQQVKVSDLKLPESVNAATEYAYDITTGMKDGNFKYEVTLPKLENQIAEVSYIEKTVAEAKNETVKEEEIKETEESKTTQETEKVKVTELDHFSIYFTVTTYADSSLTIPDTAYLQGETVYSHGVNTYGTNYYLKTEFFEPYNSIAKKTCESSTKTTQLDCNYTLPTNATINTWTIKFSNRLHSHDSWSLQDTENITVGTAAFLTVNKTLSPTNDSGKFNLLIDGINKAVDVNNGGTTGVVSVTPGSHTVSEAAGTGTSLSNYTSIIGGSCSTGGVVSLTAGQSKTCTITNTHNTGFITIKKVLSPINDNGRFDLKLDDSTIKSNASNNDQSSQTTVYSGSHETSETGHSGTSLNNYTTQYECFDLAHANENVGSGTESTANIQVDKNDNVFCTFTNTRNPYCGDGHVDSGEQCDDENSSNTDDCLNSCEVPTCNDGYIWAGTEECDGTNGVGQNQFCTNTCKLVNIYDGDNQCPVGTVKSESPLMTKNISSTDSDGETLSLTSGQTYIFETSGQYEYWNGSGGQYMADTGYATRNNWSSIDSTMGIYGTTKKGLTSLLGDMGTGSIGVINWDSDSSFNNDHIYSKAFTPAGSNVQFVISDWYDNWYDDSPNDYNDQHAMRDNTGNLTLKVYECKTNATVKICKEDNNKNPLSGWRMILRGSEKDSFDVSSGGTVVNKSYPSGNYAVLASGTYNYGNSQMNADAANSFRYVGLPCSGSTDSWVNGEATACMNNYLSLNFSTTGGPTAPGWGTYYNPDHIYAKSFSGGNLDMKIWDSCSTTGEGCYGDNEGSLNVKVYDGYVGDTESDGCVTFSEVPFGDYQLEEILQDYWTNDSGVGTVTVDDAQEKFTIVNHELPRLGSISGRKWEDLNSDGVWDSDEPAVDGTVTPVKIFVDTDNNGEYNGSPEGSDYYATIDKLGKYSFGGLVVGTYNICEKDDELTDWIRTYPVDSNCQSVTVTPNADTTADFGNAHKGKVTVYKFEDLNKNGFYDNSEPLLPNWDIVMNQVEGTVQTQKTDANGQTIFELNSADYILSENIKEGWVQTGISCGDKGERNLITSVGEAYGHHGECSGWNECGDAATCAQWACEIKGYGYLASYGEQKPCTQFNNCNLFYSRGNIQWNWGNWCNVMGVTDIYCSNTPIDSDNSHDVKVLPGDQTTCYIGNIHYGKVNVTKYHDVNQDGIKQETEPVLSGWDITLNGNTKTTSTNGQVLFENLVSTNSYTLSETIQGGWKQTNISCSGEKSIDKDNSHSVTVNAGETTNCEIGNYKIPSVSISKFNNKWPLNGAIGGNVIFTMVLHVLDNDVKDLHVMDLLPKGFAFVPGSATMNGTPMSTQPVYHSPGDWQLGNINLGEEESKEITLQYEATIDSSQEPGLYKDLAFAYGCEVSDACSIENADRILAQSVESGQTDPGIITDNYVGTKVNLAKEQQETSSAGIATTETKEQGEVLGASTSLPGTGGKTIWMIFGSILSLLGIIVLAFGIALKLKNKKIMTKIFTIIFILFSFFVLGNKNVFASSGPLTIRLEQPQSPTRLNNFKLIFTTMDMLGRDITVQCFRDGVQFSSDIPVTAGGNTGFCQVDASVMSTNNHVYTFEVKAIAGSDSTSDTVTVGYNVDKPGTPTNYSKEHSMSCQYKIKFKTADDGGKTVKVEIYRSINTSFGLDASNRIASIAIGSNTEHTYTDNAPSDCDKEWYYAVRAFDIYGNGSDWVGDSVITVTTTTTTTTSTTTTTGETTGTGAIPVVNVTLPSAEVLGAKTTVTPTKAEQKPKEEVISNVLGAATKKENRNLVIGIGIGLLIIAIIGYVIYKKKKSQI